MDQVQAPDAGSWLAERLTPRQVDWLVFGTALALSIGTLVHTSIAEGVDVTMGLVALPFATVPLLWRRTRPGLVLVVLAAAFAVSTVSVTAEPNGVGLLFGVYAAAVYGNERTRIVGGAVALGVLLVAFGTVLATASGRALGHLTGISFGYGLVWLLGRHIRTRHAYLAALKERAIRLERDRDEHARRATEQERTRIARDIHDVVMHNVSIIAVQAGAARTTSSSDPGRATDALGVIERTARSTLAELRALLGVLRKDDPPSPSRQPQPTLGQLEELVSQAREAGLRVEARVEGPVRPLVEIVDLCAYRVVQEALTNAIKHAPYANVQLLMRYGARDLQISVSNDCAGTSPTPRPPGHGLIGMKERVSLVGGELRTGPTRDGGFRVEVCLPLHDTEIVEREPASPIPLS